MVTSDGTALRHSNQLQKCTV